MDLAQECDIEGYGRLEPGWGSTRGKDSRLERLEGAECSSPTKELPAEKVEQRGIGSGRRDFQGSTLRVKGSRSEISGRRQSYFSWEASNLALASLKEDSTSSVVKGRPIGQGKAPRTRGRRNKTLSTSKFIATPRPEKAPDSIEAVFMSRPLLQRVSASLS
ncbi:hypothetical protein C8R45DRAFT_935707 [Mycena sanguinolenta]|nr:hypothetical protein C8R45DRAFT_935707 [Mycena sanguinolenta]